MTRGVNNEGPSWDVVRHRTVDRGLRGEKHFELRFSYRGGTYIEVRFAGFGAHDVINVRDYETDTLRVTQRHEFIAEVNEYMESMTAEDLRTWWENRPRSAG